MSAEAVVTEVGSVQPALVPVQCSICGEILAVEVSVVVQFLGGIQKCRARADEINVQPAWDHFLEQHGPSLD